MRQGFIFDHALCVNCKACSAACFLENEFPVKVRNIFTFNSEFNILLPVENLSIACNHCANPVCLIGCPSSAYDIDQSSGAVIIDENKCIGCRYCVWNCPYDAPKFDPCSRVVGKCNLCYKNVEEGLMPACASGCPTGALSFGDIENLDASIIPGWFPESSLDPALRFKSSMENIPLRIIPQLKFSINEGDKKNVRKKIGTEWSLVLFSFLSMISVSLIALSVVTAHLPDQIIFIAVTVLPGIFSIFHLGKWHRSWRSVLNFRRSPLSREIILYIAYSVMSIYSIIYQSPWVLVAASITGFLFLIAIDSVYYYSVRNMSAYLHSGQTFISALLVIAFISGYIIPFIFIALIKLSLSAFRLFGTDRSGNLEAFRYIRLALLIIAGASMVSGISYTEFSVIALFIIGEFIDRILFYIDFEPTGVTNRINKYLAERLYEKERN